MKLKSINIKNYRSIEDITIPITLCADGGQTYGLIGINEAGKSSLLKAISLKDGLHPVTIKDFRPQTTRIDIKFQYELEDADIGTDVLKQLTDELAPDEVPPKIDGATFTTYFEIINPAIKKHEVIIHAGAVEFTLSVGFGFDLISKQAHEVVFWTAESRYLISEPITLSTFAANPSQISIPLKNCFELSGIAEKDIQAKIALLPDDSTEREDLEKTLGESVTSHIRDVWPNHPIEITFNYNGGVINFHVKDIGVKGKAKTADQRSDGFKQFISFLLTVSAQSKHGQLANSILLLDEPETHLHPQAQQFLLKELVKIASNNKTNNLVLFATHSNYMIDKDDLSRNFKVIKTNNDKTKIERFDSKISSYASVNYEVFEIPTSDYHNELYGLLQEREGKFTEKEFEEFLVLNGLNAKEKYIKVGQDGVLKECKVTLPTKIRNQIHHPENTHNKRYSDEDLRASIEMLKRLKNEA